MRFPNLLIVAACLVAAVGCGPSLPAVSPTSPASTPAAVQPIAALTATPLLAPVVPNPTVAATATGATDSGSSAGSAPPKAATAAANSSALSALAAELAARVNEQLTPAPDPNAKADPRIAGVEVMPLGPDKAGRERFLVNSYGRRSYQPEQPHFVAAYAHDAGGWARIGQVELGNADYLDQKGATLVQIEPSRTWIAIQAGAGAHSGVFSLVSFDGTSLRLEVSHSTASPGADGVRDVNGDGRLEVVLDNSDYYVFCYACGVRLTDRGLMRWDGSKLVEVKLAPLPSGLSADVREPVARAGELAAAGLYKDAVQALDTVPAAKLTDQTAFWNATLIRLNAEARAAEARKGPYPLLGNVFYGDYAAALDVVRHYRPGDIFGQKTPLIVGTVAEPSRGEVAKRLVESTTAALKANPDLAAAYFLRGWAGFLARPQSRDWLPDIERAVQLDPKEPLFAESLSYLKAAPTVVPAPIQPVGLPNPASVNCTQKGGKLQPVTGPNGESANCIFPDGSQCEEWAFFRGECAPGSAKATATAPQPTPSRVNFAPNAVSAQVGGKLAANETRSHALRAMAGQTMTVELASTGNAARLSIQGAADGQPYLRSAADATTWTGKLPSTQDYVLKVVGGSTAADYTLKITVQ